MPEVNLPAENADRGERNPVTIARPLAGFPPGAARRARPLAGFPPGAARRRPRGWLRHYAGFLSPDAVAGVRVVLEGDREQRLHRLRAAVGDRLDRRRGHARPRMRALRVAPGCRLRWDSVSAPAPPGPDGAIVHPIACSTCDLDCPIALGATRFALPLHLGHECVAEVIAVGEQVATVKVGDRVIVPFQISCGVCPPCLAGRTASCASVPSTSMYGMGIPGGLWGGAFSDELAVPYADAMLVPLPDGIDPVAAASVADNVCDAHRHIAPHLPALLEYNPEAEVLIVAAVNSRSLATPSVALYAGLIAQAYGARNVRFADIRPGVRAHAGRLGMDALHPRELRRRAPAQLVVACSGNTLSLALSNTAPDGICTTTGGLRRSVRIPFLQMYARNTTLHIGRAHARTLIPQVLDLMTRGDLHPERVTTTVAKLDDAPSVLREHFLAGDSIKTVLTA
jgi:alcohol dehydrogenase